MSTQMRNDQATMQADPWTEQGYSEWQSNATAVRRCWMKMMGLDDDEIDEACAPGQPLDFDEELKEYNAMMDLEDIMRRCDERE